MRDLFGRDYGMTGFHINDGKCLIFGGKTTASVDR